MPDVLEYARPRTRRRMNEKRDWDLFGLSLMQVSVWVWFAVHINFSLPERGNRCTLFAFAWDFNEAGFGDFLFCILFYLLVIAAALRTAERRVKGYRTCMGFLLAGIILDAITRQYLMVQCPGAWGALLTRDYSLFDRLHLWLLLQPVSMIALIRALTPTKWESTPFEFFVFQLQIVWSLGVIVFVASIVPAW